MFHVQLKIEKRCPTFWHYLRHSMISWSGAISFQSPTCANFPQVGTNAYDYVGYRRVNVNFILYNSFWSYFYLPWHLNGSSAGLRITQNLVKNWGKVKLGSLKRGWNTRNLKKSTGLLLLLMSLYVLISLRFDVLFINWHKLLNCITIFSFLSSEKFLNN